MTELELALHRYREQRIAGYEDEDLREAMFLWEEGPNAYLLMAAWLWDAREWSTMRAHLTEYYELVAGYYSTGHRAGRV